MMTDRNKQNWPLIGNEKNRKFLEKNISSNEVSSAYIFSGPDNLGKTASALFFAKSLLCSGKKKDSILPCNICESCRRFNSVHGDQDNEDIDMVHGDCHVIKKEKDKKNISIEQVRSLIESLSMTSFVDGYKVAIIKHADKLSEKASNALLKLLEEPNKKVVIILVSSKLDLIPATLISRCQVLEFFSVSFDLIYDYLVEEHGVSRTVAKNYARLSLGRPALAVKMIEDQDFYRDYYQRIESVFGMLESSDVSIRFSLIDSLLDKKLSSIESSQIARRLLDIWQGLLRDLYLSELGLNNLLQHQMIDTKIKALSSKYQIKSIVKALDKVSDADGFFDLNLNSRLILENISLSI